MEGDSGDQKCWFSAGPSSTPRPHSRTGAGADEILGFQALSAGSPEADPDMRMICSGSIARGDQVGSGGGRPGEGVTAGEGNFCLTLRICPELAHPGGQAATAEGLWCGGLWKSLWSCLTSSRRWASSGGAPGGSHSLVSADH